MSTQKRKGSDFEAVSVATVNWNSGTESTHLSINEEWNEIQQKMNNLRRQWQEENHSQSGDELSNSLLSKPRQLQERVENLPYDAANIKEKLDKEFEDLKAKWQLKVSKDSELRRNLIELQSEYESLTGHSEELDNKIHQIRDELARSKQEEQREREARENRLREMAAKIPKLQQQISMYAMCTGIKWDYDNKEAWSGHVVCAIVSCVSCQLPFSTLVHLDITHTLTFYSQNVPSQQTYQSFHFPRGELSPEEMSDQIWVLMEGC